MSNRSTSVINDVLFDTNVLPFINIVYLGCMYRPPSLTYHNTAGLYYSSLSFSTMGNSKTTNSNTA